VVCPGGQASRLPPPGRPSEGARRGLLPHKPTPTASIGAASLDVASAPDDLSFSASMASSAKNGLHGTRSQQRCLRAPLARNFARAWRKQLARVLSCRTPWISADTAKAFTQSRLATAWRAGAISAAESVSSLATSASSHPSALWQTSQGGQEPGGAAELPKAMVHHHDSGYQRPLSISSVAQLRPGSNRILRQSLAAATHRQ
jgi:hypothetical protein